MSTSRACGLITARLNEANAASELYDTPIYIHHDNELPLDPEDIPKAPWLATHLIPVDTYSETLNSDIRTYLGLYQITIRVPTEQSKDVADAIVEKLSTLFPSDLLLLETGLKPFSTQLIEPLKEAQGRRIDNWWVVPCTLEFRANNLNNP